MEAEELSRSLKVQAAILFELTRSRRAHDEELSKLHLELARSLDAQATLEQFRQAQAEEPSKLHLEQSQEAQGVSAQRRLSDSEQSPEAQKVLAQPRRVEASDSNSEEMEFEVGAVASCYPCVREY